MNFATGLKLGLVWIGLLLLVACHDRKNDPPAPAPASTFSVGGTVSGLSGSLTLANNGGDLRSVSASGAFTFATELAAGATYNVTVATQPDDQTCTVASATGSANADVTTVAVNCVTFRVRASVGPAGGTVTGPGGAQVVIPAGALTQATDIGVARPASGWPLPLPDDETLAGSIYEFTPHGLIFDKPVVIRLPVPAGAGNLGMLVSTFGEEWHHQDVLQDANFIELERSTFSWFSGYLITLCAYSGPPQVGACTTSHASGYTWATSTPANAILMTSGGSIGFSATNSYSVTGSAGTWSLDLDTLQTLHLTMRYSAEADCGNGTLQLRRFANGAPMQILRQVPAPLSPQGKGIATIDIPGAELDQGQAVFFVRFACTRPNGQSSGGGDWITLNGTNVPITGFSLGGTVTGLNSSGLEVQLGLREVVSVPAAASNFTFGALLQDGTNYEIRILRQPQGALCTLGNRTGTISGADVSNVAVNCTPVQSNFDGYAVVTNENLGSANLFGRNSGNGMTLVDTKVTGSTPHSVVMSPNGLFAYIGNMAQNSVSSFSVDATTHKLVPITLGSPTTANPSALAMDEAGSVLLVTNYNTSTGGGALSLFRVDGTTGVPSHVSTVPTGRLPAAVAIHPGGNFAYTANEGSSDVTMFQLNRATPSLTSIGTLTNVMQSASAMAIDENGNFAYVLGLFGNINRLSINPTSGDLNSIGFTSISGGTSCSSLAVQPDGDILYVACASSIGSFVRAYAIGIDGGLTAGPTTTLPTTGPASLSIGGGGLVMHVAMKSANLVATYRIGQSSGDLTFQNSVASPGGPSAIAATR